LRVSDRSRPELETAGLTGQENLMATITASMFIALDGVVDPGVGHWHFPYYNEEMGNAVDQTHDVDVMIFGRVTYDSFAGAWPEREAAGEEDAAFAKRLGDMRKIVASRSPREFTWRNSERLDGDLIDAASALKNEPSIGRIGLSGSVSVVRQLLDADLLDELHLFVHPATAGSGLRLFEEGGPARHLKLISSQPFRTGVVHLVYGPDPNPPTGSYEQARESLPEQ
jgi:dihydrofolate reductase